MKHFDEHTLELYVLGSDVVKDQVKEIESHIAECYGCRKLVEQIRSFYHDADEQFRTKPHGAEETGKSLVRSQRDVEPWFEPYVPEETYRSPTALGKIILFTRRHPVVTSTVGLGLAAALVGLGMLISNPFRKPASTEDRNPAFVNYNQTADMLEVLNAEHELLWQRKSPGIRSPRDEETKSRVEETVVADINGDGTNEVLTCLQLLGYQTSVNDRHLLAFDSRGGLLWDKRYREAVHYLDRAYSPKFNARGISILEDGNSGRKNIFVLAHHESRSPSIIYRLNDSGNVIGTYWHFGLIVGLYLFDLNGDGKQELILCGRNDVNDTIHGEFSSVAVLDPLKVIGDRRASTCPGFDLPVSDAELYYLKFPRSDIDSADHSTSAIVRMEVNDSTYLKFVLSHFEQWNFDFYLDHNLSVVQVTSYDNTYAAHKELEDQGKLKGIIDAAYLERLREGVRYWDGRKWQKSVTRVELYSPPPPFK
ncbi:MAG TPA: hypothetical protein VLY03_07010 [Bacteroidota bacterium]|nr:hypothetical protein [Bacteroidota bacterium]